MNTQDQFHFYASSIADWRTTTSTRDLRSLLKLMDKFGYPYNLFFVPVAHDAPLIAAMRCYVASNMGDNIDIPEGLK